MNYQIVKGVIPPIDLRNFKVVEEETDAIYLSEKELAAIYELDLSGDKQLEEKTEMCLLPGVSPGCDIVIFLH
ncbi:hypothetical protein [Bacteroides faecis]|uniref:hypothetical protein n=1 Tax=Bacteroides faecis TaxID=674529 RepID=UPI00286E1808|nr:hypothetical protein [Bacteroides faecis]MCS2234076.1 hypothetical protein [Bacteroides faecis]